MTDLTNLSISKAKELMNKKEFTASELVKAYLDRALEYEFLNSFVRLTPELAMSQASLADERIRKGEGGVIEGIPIAIKDLFCTAGIPTTACSKMLENFVPTYESTVTSLLYQNGGICLGKTNMDEFAMGSANSNSYFGQVINPWKRKGDDTSLVPGGSSGGSAAAVAARISMGALGSDTGGSIRQPASFCGIVGLKPSYGRCSRWGMVAFASSLDQAGVFAGSVQDAALLLESICGYDPKDSTTVNLPVPKFSDAVGKSIKGLKVGIPNEYMVDGMDKGVLDAWELGKLWLKEAGAEIVNISLPHTKFALATYYIIAPAEASSNLARYDGVRYGFRFSKPGQEVQEMMAESRAIGFGSEVKRRIMMGTYALSAESYGAYYTKAQQVRHLIARDFSNAFEGVDVILTPTTPSTAFAVNEKISNPITMYLNDILTVPASLAGLPGISVPVVKMESDGLPLGLQLIGRLYDEESVLKFGAVLEKAASFQRL